MMNSGEDLGFVDLSFGLALTPGEILIDADRAGEPLLDEDDDDEEVSSELAPPPLLSA